MDRDFEILNIVTNPGSTADVAHCIASIPNDCDTICTGLGDHDGCCGCTCLAQGRDARYDTYCQTYECENGYWCCQEPHVYC